MIKHFDFHRIAWINGPEQWRINVFKDSAYPDTVAHWAIFSNRDYRIAFGTFVASKNDRLIENAIISALYWLRDNSEYFPSDGERYARRDVAPHWCVLSRHWELPSTVDTNVDKAYFSWVLSALYRGLDVDELGKAWKEHEAQLVQFRNAKLAESAIEAYRDGKPLDSLKGLKARFGGSLSVGVAIRNLQISATIEVSNE